MARPAIAQEKYIEAIEEMISAGTAPAEITATKIQKVVGGQYSRCVSIVDDYLADIKEQHKAEMPAMPPWFNDFVSAVQQAAAGQWFKVAGEIRAGVDEVTAAFAEKKAILEAQRREDLEQIAGLEVMIERQEEALAASRAEAAAAAGEIRAIGEKAAVAEARAGDLASRLDEAKKQIAHEQAARAAAVKEAAIMEGRLAAAAPAPAPAKKKPDTGKK